VTDAVRLVSFLVVAWALPPAIAGALGWNGIWGTGSAFWDSLIPFPTTGGFLHLPSIAGCAALIAWRKAGVEPFATLSRPLATGIALAGVALMLDIADLHLAATTDVAPYHLLTANPLGLFLLSDGVLAQLWLPRLDRARRGAGWLAAGLLAALAPACLVGCVAYRQAPSAHDRLLRGMSWEGPARGDEIVTVYSSIGFVPAELEAELRADPMRLALPPEQHENAEDQAIYFFDSLSATRERRLDGARLAWCRYEDGTPSHWVDDGAECFADHVSFAERWEQLRDGTDPELSPDVRSFVARRLACANVVLAPGAEYSGVAAQRRCTELPRLREELLARASSERDLRALRE
jgi:hypothetical protein